MFKFLFKTLFKHVVELGIFFIDFDCVKTKSKTGNVLAGNTPQVRKKNFVFFLSLKQEKF